MKSKNVLHKALRTICGLCLILPAAALLLAAHDCCGAVTTTRDDKGVWFVQGSETDSLYDMFEAVGYAVAEDRLWQAEIYRRSARGRLSELLGSSLLDTDIYLRTRGYSDQELQEAFDALDAESQEVVRGYVAGFNRCIADIRRNLFQWMLRPNKPEEFLLPPEFVVLGVLSGPPYVPEQWTAADVLAWAALFQRNFDGEALATGQIESAALFQELEAKFPNDFQDMFNDLRWTNDPDAPTYIPAGEAAAATISKKSELPSPAMRTSEFPGFSLTAQRMAEIRTKVVESLKKINAYVKMGSYAWVVSGDKTSSGNPILYSGPQMGFPVPSTILEGSIKGGGLNVSGMALAGLPGILIGRTPHHAWGFMTGHAHTVDFYVENPSDVFLHRTETIRVAGQEDDYELQVYRTAHGPVVSPMPYNPATYDPNQDGPIISWNYSQWGYELGSVKAPLDFARASSMDDFAVGIERIGVSMHSVYADRDGNIAYWLAGRDPVRPPGEWRLPQGFAGAALEWDSSVLKPRSTDRNTSQAFYCGWNNKTNSTYESGFNSTSYMFGPAHRVHVIQEYLASNDNLDFEDLRDLGLNIATTDSFGGGGNPWTFVSDAFSAAVDANPAEAREAALTLLEQWDGHFVGGGPSEWATGADRADAWVLMDAWTREVIRLTFEDELATATMTYEDQGDALLFNVLLHGLAGESSGIVNNYNWFQNLSDPTAPQTADSIIVQSLDNVLGALGEKPWGENARGEIVYRHDIFGVVHTTPFSSRSTYGHCVELGPSGPVRIESFFPLGESGNILSPHFLDMAELFDVFEHRPFPLFD